MLDKMLSDDMLNEARKHLRRKKGAPGVDGMTVGMLESYWKKHGAEIICEIKEGIYTPRPVMICEIPKPGKKEKRRLEIPCMIDRMILYAMQLVLSEYYEPQFSKNCYGFRKGKGCLDALKKGIDYVNSGTDVVIDLDIRKFFDTVDHKCLFQLLGRSVTDETLLTLIRNYVEARIKYGKGKIGVKKIGISQGAAISPLLANIYLNELDQYLERKNIDFVRYADDMAVFCHTRDEAQDILDGIKEFIQQKLKLSLNEEKTQICRPCEMNFLGYAFVMRPDKTYALGVSSKAKERAYSQIYSILMDESISAEEVFEKLGAFNRGWINYYGQAEKSEMILFMDEIAQYEREQIQMRIQKSGDQKREYIAALYNSKGYSSMKGWYEKTGNTKEQLERSEEMSSKYNSWRSGKKYDLRFFEGKSISRTIGEPLFIYEKDHLRLSKFHPKEVSKPDPQYRKVCLAVLSVLAAGKCMMFSQLYVYLVLLGVSIPKRNLTYILYYMCHKEILSNEVLYTKDGQGVMGYHLTSKSRQYMRYMSAPRDYVFWSTTVGEGGAKFIYDVCSCILWNQIVLNTLLFDQDFQYYHLYKTVEKEGTEITVPLCVQTDQKRYYEYISRVTKRRVQTVVCKWVKYYRHYPNEKQYVIVVNSYEDMKQVCCYLTEEFKIRPYLRSDHIALSCVHSWFRDQEGITIPYHDV